MHSEQIGDCLLLCGDCRDIAPGVGPIDACVTDPPYELGFMGKSWDSSGVAATAATWEAIAAALKPGAHLLAFAGSRTYHRIASAIEDAGFEIRDQLMWLYGSGFPKSLDVGKSVDKIDVVGPRRERALLFTSWMRSTGISARQINAITGSNMGSHYLTAKEQPEIPTQAMFDLLRPHLPPVPQEIESLIHSREIESQNLKRREVVGQYDKKAQAALWRESYGQGVASPQGDISLPYSLDAQRWDGWGTALKPAHEPVAMARKPFRGSVAANVLKHGTGALNIDACRLDEPGKDPGNQIFGVNTHMSCYAGDRLRVPYDRSKGRWPANVLHDGSLEVLEAFPARDRPAARFFYSPKATRGEREFGLDSAQHFSAGAVTSRLDGSKGLQSPRAGAGRGSGAKNIHPTVKPTDLMAWLIQLVTQPGGKVLDPFMGSGSTGIAAVRHGFQFVGIEQSPEYFDIACRRIEAAVAMEERQPSLEREITKAVRAQQLKMFEAELMAAE